MGTTQSNIANATATVLNEVNEVVESVNLIYLIILLVAQLATTFWQLHKRWMRKRYEGTFSMANAIDKI